MPNDYFNHTVNRVVAAAKATASQINNIADEVAAAFDKIPDEVDVRGGIINLATNTGTAAAMVASLSYTPSLADGYEVRISTSLASTGPATLNLNGLGVKTLVNSDGTPIAIGSIAAGTIIDVYWDVANDQWVLSSSNHIVGSEIPITLLTPITMSGTTQTFAIPVGVNKFIVALEAVDWTGFVHMLIGDSVTGQLTSGYQGTTTSTENGESTETYVIDNEIWLDAAAVARAYYGLYVFEKVDDLKWTWDGNMVFPSTILGSIHTSTGWIQLTAGSFLDEITFNASTSFDGGVWSCKYEG